MVEPLPAGWQPPNKRKGRENEYSTLKVFAALAVFSVGMLATAGTLFGAEGDGGKPNIIVMMVDDMGYVEPSIGPFPITRTSRRPA